MALAEDERVVKWSHQLRWRDGILEQFVTILRGEMNEHRQGVFYDTWIAVPRVNT